MSTPDYDAAKLPPYSAIDEPLLAFATDDSSCCDTHPLRGIVKYGPYTRSAMATFTPQIRVATVGPAEGQPAVRELVGSLRKQHAPGDRRDYVPAYPGCSPLLHIDFVPASAPEAHLAWPDRLDDLGTHGAPHERLAAAIAKALRRLADVRDHFDVATIHLPDKWAAGFRTDTFDAHDSLKSLGAAAGIPTQVINDRTFTFPYRASVAWRLSIALYVKAGGIPWKLAAVPGVPEDTAYIGLAYALRGDPRDARFVTCCSQVFDADGGGMQFVAYEARDRLDEPEQSGRNPYLSRADMRVVMARSLRLYQNRNGGAVPRRVVIHKTTPFRPEEIAGAAEAFEAVEELECVEVTTKVGWRGVWLQQSRSGQIASEPDRYPVPRGTMLPISGTSALLWAAGNAPAVSAKGNFYQGGKSIPRPLLLTRHAGAGPLEVMSVEALALTKMDWNNDALYDPVPVTIKYSQRLARTIAHAPEVAGHVYPYRLFM